MEQDRDEDDGAGPSSPPSPGDGGWEFEVFLSFRGEDTRKGFTGHLYQALLDKGIRTFIDDRELEKGQRVKDLLRYIEKSKICVPIFSKGYADSKWCLKEIAKIAECGKTIVPVFLDVEPSVVRNQTESFQSAFEEHEKNDELNKEDVRNWRDALRKVGEISGYNLKDTDRHEANLIQLILKRILKGVTGSSLDVAKHPVGLDSRLNDLMPLLEIESHEVRMVGMCGMGGIGKTTLAKAVYNQLSSSFEASSFLENVRETAKQHNGVVTLQKQLLRDVLKTEIEIGSISEGITEIKKRISSKNVLIVIDDVDDRCQLDALAVHPNWFSCKSRIIITSRDGQLLKKNQTNVIYQLRELDDAQSLQLFCWHAFGKCEPTLQYRKLSKEVVAISGRLPLCLEILGSHFVGMETIEEWKTVLKKLKEDPEKDEVEKVHERLKISYDALDKKAQCIFLDIACFFIGKGRESAVFMWEASNLFPESRIKVLAQKSLLSISDETGEFKMHDQIRDMGRKIVLRQSPGQSRFWEADIQMLEELNGRQETKENIEGIICQYPRTTRGLTTMCFDNMSKLRLLDLSRTQLTGPCRYLPNTIKWLAWKRCPLKSLPTDFDLSKVVVLDLVSGKIERVWDGDGTFHHLKVLNLEGCKNLRSCPDFRRIPNVAKLIFDDCYKLTRVDESIGVLKSLVCLSMARCYSLKKIPDSLCQLSSLETLNLFECMGISTLPEHLGDLRSLKDLNLGHCVWLTKIDESIGDLKSLARLNTEGCRSLEKIPNSLCQLSSLEMLVLRGCPKVSTLPQHLGDLMSLNTLIVHGTSMKALPESVTRMKGLMLLSLSWGWKELPEQIGALKSLRELRLQRGEMQRIPESINLLTNLQTLDLTWCKDLLCIPQLPPSLIKLFAVGCSSLETASDISHLSALSTLDLQGCTKLIDVPGLENLKCLKVLNLEECNSLSDALWERLKVANFEGFKQFTIPARPSGSYSSRELQTFSFLIPNVPHVNSFTVLLPRTTDRPNSFSSNIELEKDGSLIFERSAVKCKLDWSQTRFMLEKEEEEEIVGRLADGNGYRVMLLTIQDQQLKPNIVLKR